MIYGYARVSTKGQATDGNSLEVQRKILKDILIYIQKNLLKEYTMV